MIPARQITRLTHSPDHLRMQSGNDLWHVNSVSNDYGVVTMKTYAVVLLSGLVLVLGVACAPQHQSLRTAYDATPDTSVNTNDNVRNLANLDKDVRKLTKKIENIEKKFKLDTETPAVEPDKEYWVSEWQRYRSKFSPQTVSEIHIPELAEDDAYVTDRFRYLHPTQGTVEIDNFADPRSFLSTPKKDLVDPIDKLLMQRIVSLASAQIWLRHKLAEKFSEVDTQIARRSFSRVSPLEIDVEKMNGLINGLKSEILALETRIVELSKNQKD